MSFTAVAAATKEEEGTDTTPLGKEADAALGVVAVVFDRVCVWHISGFFAPSFLPHFLRPNASRSRRRINCDTSHCAPSLPRFLPAVAAPPAPW